MMQTIFYNGSDEPFLGGTGALIACHGGIASQARWLGAAIEVRTVAPLCVGNVPGSSVPIGRRLRT